MAPMATRKRRRSAKARKPPKTLPSPPTPVVRQVGPLEQKIRGVGLKLLEIAEEDPERLVRMGEGAVSGLNSLYRFFQDNPGAVQKVVRDTIISNVARATKKKLRGE